jgi:hypothetical protein
MNIKYYLLAVSVLLCFTCKQKSNKDALIEFVPNTTYSEILFPWKDVISCFSDTLDNKNFKNEQSCPKCELYSEQLIWIYFKSPAWTWEHLCGRAGPLSICPMWNTSTIYM